jgi:hypothetical protein
MKPEMAEEIIEGIILIPVTRAGFKRERPGPVAPGFSTKQK